MKKKYVLFSYFPLLRGKAGDLIDTSAKDPKLLTKQLGEWLKPQEDLGHVETCGWTISGAEVSPVLVLKDMNKIVDHIKEWSENDPEHWFNLYIYEAHNRYAVAFMPNIKTSVNRFKATMKLVHGIDVGTPGEIEVIFKPLVFTSGQNPETFRIVKNRLGETALVKFADITNMNTIRTLGRFKVYRDSCMGMLDKYLKEESEA